MIQRWRRHWTAERNAVTMAAADLDRDLRERLDERENRQRQPLRNEKLGRLRAPGHEERGRFRPDVLQFRPTGGDEVARPKPPRARAAGSQALPIAAAARCPAAPSRSTSACSRDCSIRTGSGPGIGTSMMVSASTVQPVKASSASAASDRPVHRPRRPVGSRKTGLVTCVESLARADKRQLLARA